MESNEAAFLAKLQATFKIEAEEHLKNLNANLLFLEKKKTLSPPQDLLEKVFREAHSLKGAARSVNHQDIQLICQALENVFLALKVQRIVFSQDIFDTLYECVDLIGKLLNKSSNSEFKGLLSDMIQKLDAITITQPAIPPKETISAQSSDGQITKDENFIAEGTQIHKVEETEDRLKSSGKDQELNSSETTNPMIQTKENQANESSAKQNTSPGEPSLATDMTVRASLNKLDRLFQQTEELLTVKLASQQQVNDLKRLDISLQQSNKELMRLEEDVKYYFNGNEISKNKSEEKIRIFFERHHTFIKSHREDLIRLIKSSSHDYRLSSTMIDTLLEEIKKLLMQPFSTLLESFPRMVRDISHQLKKEVELNLQGTDIEIDRRILEEIKDPLIHLIRNCIDHGIELPIDRKINNKPSMGTISIIISQLRSNSVEIIVSDDGKGISYEAVKQAAVKQNIISQKEADSLINAESKMLIFHSGISTSQIITELSGRGLGMGIVAEKVDKLGGQVTIDSSSAGTIVRMVLPLTLATFRGIQVKVSGQTFIMPTHNVRRVIRVKADEVKFMENRPTISIDGSALSYVHLRDILGIPANQSDSDREWLNVLIIKAAEQIVAFGTDAILNEQEVLIKPFGRQLTRVKNILSSTVVERGKVIPILNPSDLVKSIMSGNYKSEVSLGQKNGVEAKTIKKILLAEDSITTRMLLKNILESAGYDVTVAVDGQEALNLLKEKKIDLLLSDIQMPNMDGFTLTETVRQLDAFKNLPVILCTSLTSQADRERGVEVGANAYLDKVSFRQSLLLEIIEELL